MPTKPCGVCNKFIHIPETQWGMLDHEGLFVCGLPCVQSWAESQEPKSPPFISVDGALRALPNPDSGPFRSKYEEKFALWLTERGRRFQFEAFTFLLGETGSYTPDFYLPGNGCFIETKGRWGLGQKAKLAKFRCLYPDVRLLVVPGIIAEEIVGKWVDRNRWGRKGWGNQSRVRGGGKRWRS